MTIKTYAVLIVMALVGLPGSIVAADNPPPQYPGPYLVDLKVGGIFVVGNAVDIVRPVRSPICDDLKVVAVVDTPDGLGFKGVAPGKTLCSVASGVAMTGNMGARRVFEIRVHE